MKVLSVLLAFAVGAIAGAPESGAEWNATGVKLYAQARYREAEGAFRKAVDKWEKEGAGTARDIALALGNLGCSVRAQGRFAESETLLLDSLHKFETLSGPDSVDAARALQYLGALYREQSDPAAAEPVLVCAERFFEAQLDAGAPELVSNRQLLASVYLDQGRFAEAETLLKMTTGGDGLSAVIAYNDLASAALERHDAVAAEAYARQARDRVAAVFPAGGDPVTAGVLNNLAQAYRFEHRYIEAEKTYRQSLDIWRKVYGEAHPSYAGGLINLAGMYHDMGYDDTAEKLDKRAIQIYDKALGAGNAKSVEARGQLTIIKRAAQQAAQRAAVKQAERSAFQNSLEPERTPPQTPVAERPLSQW